MSLKPHQESDTQIFFIVQPGSQQLITHSLPPELPGTVESHGGIVGAGGYSVIYQGEWSTPGGTSIPVGIKRIRTSRDISEERFRTRIAREIGIWSRAQHPNILAFLGYQFRDETVILVSPWCRNGSLASYIEKNPLKGTERLKLLCDAARGLEYLHTLNRPIVHGDVKPHNILITDDLVAVLCNFGIFRFFESLDTRTGLTTEGGAEPIQYLAKELIEGGNTTTATDVYAFSGLILAVMSGNPPFWKKTSAATVMRAIAMGQIPSPSDHPALLATDPIWVLLRQCWAAQPETRPSMSVVLTELGAQMQKRKEPFLHLRKSLGEKQSKLRIERSQISFSGSNHRSSYPAHGGMTATLKRQGLNAPGTEPSNEMVFVKIIKLQEDSEASFSDFVRELSILAGLSHPNILKIFGFVENFNEDTAWLVLEQTEYGNIREFLEEGTWDIPERINLIKDVVEGLLYLHSRKPPIRHGDLKSANVIVNSVLQAIITDFGSARALTMGKNSEAPKFTLRWAAPEIISGQSLVLPSDVWSFGWLCWEIMTGMIPFHDFKSEPTVTASIIGGRLPMIREHSRLSESLQLCSVIETCWQPDPEKRPTVAECQAKLKWIPSCRPVRVGADKKQSTALLLALGETHLLQSEAKKALVTLDKALEVSKSRKESSSVARALRAIGHAYRIQSNFAEADKSFAEALGLEREDRNGMGEAHTLIGIGATKNLGSKLEAAKESYAKALVIYSDQGSVVGRADALLGLGRTYSGLSKYDEAKKDLTQALGIYRDLRNDLGRATTLLELAHLSRIRHNLQEAEAGFAEVQGISQRIGYQQGIADALAGLVQVRQEQGRDSEAEEFGTRALEIYSSIGDIWGKANMLHGLGNALRARGMNDKAEGKLKEARALYDLIDNPRGRANALLELGYLYRLAGRYEKAEETFTDALALHDGGTDDQGRADIILGLGRLHCSRRKYSDARENLDHALKIYERINNQKGIANTLIESGYLYRIDHKYEEAEKRYKEAEQLHAKIGYQQGSATALCRMGEAYFIQRKYDKARGSYQQACAISVGIPDIAGEANANLGLAQTMSAQSSVEEARKLYEKALAGFQQVGDSRGRAESLLGQGHIFRVGGKVHEAEECLIGAEATFTSARHEQGRADALVELGHLYRAMGRYARAESSYNEALAVYNEVGKVRGEANALVGLGHISRMQARYPPARQMYEKAGAIYKDLGEVSGEKSVSRYLALIKDLEEQNS